MSLSSSARIAGASMLIAAGGAVIVLPQVASAHYNNASASCEGLQVDANFYEPDVVSTITVTVNGAVTSWTFGESTSRWFPFEPGQTNTWTYQIDAPGTEYDDYDSGTVEGCVEPTTTTEAPTTTLAPTTTAAPTTTLAPTTTAAPTTSRPATTAAPTTTVSPVTTTPVVTTTPPVTTARRPTTTEPSEDTSSNTLCSSAGDNTTTTDSDTDQEGLANPDAADLRCEGRSLPATGSSAATTGVIGATLVALGGVALFAGRRRKVQA